MSFVSFISRLLCFFQMENVVAKFECILKKYEDKNAVTYLDEKAGDFENLTYKGVKDIFETCCQNISKNITEEHCCVALLMEHNAYIPSLVMRYIFLQFFVQFFVNDKKVIF